MVPLILMFLLIIFSWLFKTGRSKIFFIFSSYLLFELILTGLINIKDLVLFFNLVQKPILLIISQIIICYIFHSIGFFKWAAHTIVFTAEGSEIKLLLHILLFSTILTVFTNIYVSIVVVTILILDISKSIKLDEFKTVKFILYSSVVIEISSLMSPSSSLTNLIYIGLFRIEYNSFISKLFSPGLLAVTALFILIYVLNRKQLGYFTNSNIVNPDTFVSDWKLLNLCFLVIFIIQISYFIIGNNKVSLYILPTILSIVLLFYLFKRRKYNQGVSFLKGNTLFVLAIIVHYLIIYGLLINSNYYNLVLGCKGFLTAFFIPLKVKVYLASTILASLLGNIPGAFLNANYMGVLKDSPQNSSIIYISVIGNVIGGKLLYFGSLNSIILDRVMKVKGVHVSLSKYFKTVLPVLILSSLILMITALLII